MSETITLLIFVAALKWSAGAENKGRPSRRILT